MPETFEEQLQRNNKVVVDIIQQALTTGVLRLDADAVKKAMYEIMKDVLVDGAGVTLTLSDSANTITITAP